MRRHLVVLTTLVLALGLATPLWACDDGEEQAYLLDEILRLSHEGVPDRIIIKQMRTMDFVFCLTAADIIELRELGVSDDVLEAIIETALIAEEERQEVRREVVHTYRISPGYWSPWYRYPCGWGSYYDPFPTWYSYYYYPFLYECSFAWYGWVPSTYYYTYNWYDVAWYYSPHDANYRDEAGLTLASNRPGQLVSQPPNYVPSAGAPPVASTPVAAPRRTAQETGNDYLRSISRDELGRTPYRSTSVATPPPVRASTPAAEDLLQQKRSSGLQVHQPQPVTPQQVAPTSRAQPLEPASPPTVTPRSSPRTTTPTVQPRRSTPTPATPPPAVRSRPTSRPATSVQKPRTTRPSTQRLAPRHSVVPQRKAPARVKAPTRTRTAPVRVKPASPPVRRAPAVKPAAPAKKSR
jgi:hypothetical protein